MPATNAVKPFLKWAGGKGRLLGEIRRYYPFDKGAFTKYAEPFAGGGAVLFDILSRYELEAVYISDTNRELINAYCAVRSDIDALTALLSGYQAGYTARGEEGRKAYYLEKRARFNALKESGGALQDTEKAALLIFLNKTCFNGLYRVNKKGLFNVPPGAYKNPLICDEKNLRAISEKLQDVTIVCGDYRQAEGFIDRKTFAYFDPPYRPITCTASFTAYTETAFTDKQQLELARFICRMHKKGARFLLSNSDPENTDADDDFFDRIYAAYAVKRVEASRMINCNNDA